MYDPKNNRAPLLYYIKLCASFQIHQWIHSGVTVQKRPIWFKINDFFSHVTLKFDVWPWKTTGHLFYVMSSFVHHFIAIGEFKQVLSSETPNLGQIRQFLQLCDLKFDRWPCKTIGHFFYATSSFVHHCIAIGEFKLELQSSNAQFRSNSTIFRSVWPWNLTYDLEKTIGHLS